ncbi:hypothetical protein TNCV_3107431 [Trichonephila clavipes]|nr:hypothetical protein TNCV_3107431 [Trichonephila clavipes]
MTIENKVLLYTAVLRPILSYGCPVWGYAAKTTTSLHIPTSNQVVPFPPKTATPSGIINNYDLGWDLALRAICLATDSDITR